MEKIDFVIAWVDGNDASWQKEKEAYESDKDKSQSTSARYRDWGFLKYWFRAVERYAPWVNKIHFVTWGHIPEWLNTENPKINIVRHEDYIPKEYLPTFSSHVIELNFHRIKDISEKFVYFNDDMFLNNKIKIEDFFRNGLPCDSAILNVHCAQKSNIIHQISNNDVGVINDYFKLKESIRKRPFNFFNFKYGFKNNVQNLVLSSCPRFPGFKQFHVATPLLKSTYEELWNKEFDILNATCMNKFRTALDVNQWIMREWQIASNNFNVTNYCKTSKYIEFNELNNTIKKSEAELRKALKRKKYKIICVNDTNYISEFDKLKKIVLEDFQRKYTEKSSFEL